MVHLDSLTGFEFQDFCARVFERLHYSRVQIMPYASDKGRDLIIHDVQGTKIIVECKHQPSATIGRPVVQKLHSAVVTEKAGKGIIVTTGKFSPEAIIHARAISPQIELVDMNLLRDMCARALIHPVTTGERESVFYFPLSNGNDVAKRATSTIMPRIVSRPTSPNSLLKLHETQLTLRPIYRIRYSVHQDFEQSARVIHSIHLDDQELLLDGTTGLPMVRDLNEFLRGAGILEDAKIEEPVHATRRISFQVDQTTLTQKAKRTITNLHSKRVAYYGHNNRYYEKDCTPVERNITLRDVRQVYFPEWSISMLALFKTYRITLVEKPDELLLLENQLSDCRICNKPITGEMLLCNSCGNIVHRRKPHGYKCRSCEKSVCRNCVYWSRRWIFFKEFVCGDCAGEKQRLQKKTHQLVMDAPQKQCVSCRGMVPQDATRCIKCLAEQPELGPEIDIAVTHRYSEEAGIVESEVDDKNHWPTTVGHYWLLLRERRVPSLEEIREEVERHWQAWDLPYDEKQALTLALIASTGLFLIGIVTIRFGPIVLGVLGLLVCYYWSDQERSGWLRKKLDLQ
ncbi:MAG: restriction endonuclease [Candidatus Bathyarchaeia archaeon]